MDVLRLIGLAMVICFSCVTLRGRNPEFALLVSLAGGLLILGLIFSWLKDVVGYFEQIVDRLNIPSEGVLILVKCLGLSYVAKIACDTCNDCGETSTATKIEFAAKIGMLITALPIFEQLLSVVSDFSA